MHGGAYAGADERYASPAGRSAAVALAAALASSGGGALGDATDVLCASWPTLDPPVVRSVLTQHRGDAQALLASLCELAGEAPPPRSQLPTAARAEAQAAAAAAEEFDAELSLALALSESEHEYATRGGAYHAPPRAQQPAPPLWLPAPAPQSAPAPSRPLPPLPLHTWQPQPPAQPPRDSAGGRGARGAAARGRGRGAAGRGFQQQRPFVPYFPRDATASRGWMAAWLPDGSEAAMPPPPQVAPPPAPLPPPPLPLPLPVPLPAAFVIPPPPPVAEPMPVPIVPMALEAPSSSAALLQELFPELPLDIESLVATLGPEEATRICFEIMEAASADADGGPGGDELGGSGSGCFGAEEEMSIPEQLGVLQEYFPSSAVEALFETLSLEGSLDGAIAALMAAESAAEASAEAQALTAATAPPTGKEKEKVAQLRHAYPAADKELLLAALRAAHGSHRGAVAKLDQMGLESGSLSTSAAVSASNGAAATRGRAGRFAAATAAAASAPPMRRGGIGSSGERREWRGRFTPPSAAADRSAAASGDEGPSYDELRREASAHYDAVRAAIDASRRAADAGDRAEAARCQAAARASKALAEAANASAGALTLATRNAGNHSRVQRDLHALHVAEAVQEVERWIGFMATAHSGGTMQLQFVTGRGAHSAQGAKILPAVEEYLGSRGIPWVLANGGGAVEVTVDERLRQMLMAGGRPPVEPAADAAFGDAAAGPARYEGIKRGGDF